MTFSHFTSVFLRSIWQNGPFRFGALWKHIRLWWRTAAALHSLKCQQPQRLCDDEAVGCKKASGRAWPADDLVIFHLFDQLINALLPAPRFVGETVVDHRLPFVAEAEGQRRLCAEQRLPQSIGQLDGKAQFPFGFSRL